MFKLKLLIATGVLVLAQAQAWAQGSTKYREFYSCYRPVTAAVRFEFSTVRTIKKNGEISYSLEQDVFYTNEEQGVEKVIKVVSNTTPKNRLKTQLPFDFQALDSTGSQLYTFDGFYTPGRDDRGRAVLFFNGQGEFTYPVDQGFQTEVVTCIIDFQELITR